MTGLPAEIRAESSTLFHDTRLEDVDPSAHKTFVIARVLERGSAKSVAALVRHYGMDDIRRFFADGSSARVSARTTALWRVFLRLREDECTSKLSRRIRSPFFRA